MEGYVTNIERDTIGNDDFRRVLFTGPNTQLVLMTLRPGEEIGLETHPGHDQFIRVEYGTGIIRLNGVERHVSDGSAVVVPAGVQHNVVNTSSEAPMRLYTLYSPPEHPKGTVHHTKQEALSATTQKKTRPGSTSATVLEAGNQAPPFTLRSPDRPVSLKDFGGRPVVLAFYPGDFSPVCGDQMALYNEILPDFREMGAELLGISVDSVWCHAAFARERNLHFPLLADFHPKGAVSRLYNAYCETEGTSERAIFVVDRDGKIHWSYLSPIDINPGADGIIEALSTLQAGSGGASRVAARSAQDEARP